MARTAQVLHLAESPNDSFLLKAELAEEGIPCQLLALSPGEDLARAVAGSSIDLLVVDVPLSSPAWRSGLDEIQRTRPELPVVFRWGGTGNWSTESSSEQLGRRIRGVLSLPDTLEAHRRRAPRVPRSAGAAPADLPGAAALRLLELRRGHQADHRARRRPARSRARQRVGVHRGSQGHRLPRPVRALDADARAAAAGVVVPALPGDARVVADARRRRRAARSADQRAGRIVPGAARRRCRCSTRRSAATDAWSAWCVTSRPAPRASGRCSSSAAPAGWRAWWRGRWTSASAGSWPSASSAPSGSTRSDGWRAASPTTSTTASPRSSATSIRAWPDRTATRAPRSPTSATS